MLDHTGLALFLQVLPVSRVPSSGVAQSLAVEEPDDARAGEDSQVGKADIEAEVHAVLTRNILGLDGYHQVPVVATLYKLGNAVGETCQLTIGVR